MLSSLLKYLGTLLANFDVLSLFVASVEIDQIVVEFVEIIRDICAE